MIERLRALESQARQLDPSADQFDDWLRQVAAFGRRFLAEVDGLPAVTAGGGHGLDQGFSEQSDTLPQILAVLEREVLGSGINAASGRFMGYIPGGGIPAAAVGDFLAALTNRYAGVFAASPGAAEIENVCVRWLCDLVGYGPSAWGTLLSGGTLATLTALTVARDSRPACDWPRAVAYSTAQTHHAFDKCLRIIGLGDIQRTLVATDAKHRMRVSDLLACVATDRAAGLSPWLVCATAGTTNTGAVDPLGDILAFCRSEDLWAHVDAAYGGCFLLTEQGKKLLSGVRDADSVVLDPHKGLFLPYGCGAVVVKDGERLRRAFASTADYLADVDAAGDASPADFSPEGTRHFRGLRMWLPLALHGLANYRAALEEKLLLARYVYEQLKTLDGIEMGPEPELSCVVFRASAGDAATRELLRRIIDRGQVYASSTRLEDRLTIRLCILNFRTHLAHVEQAVSDIAACLAARASG